MYTLERMEVSQDKKIDICVSVNNHQFPYAHSKRNKLPYVHSNMDEM